MVDGAPEIAEFAVVLHEGLVQMPPPLGIATHVRHPLLSDLGGEHWANRFHQNRTVSWLMSNPRSASRSSTLRSESGYRTYIITTKRITSGELLKYRNGLLMAQAYHGQRRREKTGLTVPFSAMANVDRRMADAALRHIERTPRHAPIPRRSDRSDSAADCSRSERDFHWSTSATPHIDSGRLP